MTGGRGGNAGGNASSGFAGSAGAVGAAAGAAGGHGGGGGGGDGGLGGHGGVRAGGPSIGILFGGGSVPSLNGNAFAIAPAGVGGASSGNPGPSGVASSVFTP